MKNTSRRLATIAACIAIVLPAMASAEVIDSNAQIQALLAQIQTLQKQVVEMMKQHASTTGSMSSSNENHGGSSACHMFMRDLKRGDRGDDVSDLQKELSEDHDVFPEGQVTGFFGPATARAVKKFQEKFGIASTSTGFFGPRSRNFMHGRCGGNEGKGHDEMKKMSSSTNEGHEGSGENNDLHPMRDMR